MERFFGAIVNHKKIVLIVFAAVTLLCMLLSTGVSINYNILDYLPDSAPSTQAVDIMEQEFGGGVSNAKVMVCGVSIQEALELKKQIQQIDGVHEILWLDDSVNMYVPLETADQKIVENYYKDENALFSLNLNDNKKIESIAKIRNLISDSGFESAFAGSAVNTAAATETSSKEVQKITLILLPIVFLILLLTTSSWFEPVLFLATIGIAIVLNRGTNLFFGEISFVTNSAGGILQLAVSMDYSIFLLHRFADYRHEGDNVSTAMIKALKAAFSTITASGVTTVIGFAALALMQFKIGPDMGFVMAKAIILSMLCVLLLLPVLTLLSYKLIDKTEHKPLFPKWGGFARLVGKLKVPALIIFLILLIPSFLAQNANDFYYGASKMFPDTSQVSIEKAAIETVFGRSNQMVILIPQGDMPTEKTLSEDLQKLPEVTNVISFVDIVGVEIPPEFLDSHQRSKLISQNYSRMILTVNCEFEGELAFAFVERAKNTIAKYYDEFYLAGETANTFDLKSVVTADMVKVNFVAIAAVFLVLLLTMKSLILPFILVLAIEAAIWINMAVPYFSDQPIFYIAYLIISSIQLGATVDYAILLSTRYLEERKLVDKNTALFNTLSGVTLSVLTSGGILTLGGLVLGIISSNEILSQLGTFIGRGAILSVVIVLTVLPALLYCCDGLIGKTTKNAHFIKGENKS